MANLCALVAAAGRGTRAGLQYPKTLFLVKGKSILVRVAESLAPYDSQPTVVVSPDGKTAIRRNLDDAGLQAHLVVQAEPRGMGDAVLCFSQSPVFYDAEQVLLVWGDIPFIQPKTIAAIVAEHSLHGNDFTFATRVVDAAYTMVIRDFAGNVTSVVETREQGISPVAGEREIGLFVFRKELVFDMLERDLPGKCGKLTGEHGFLYVIGHLAAAGYKVAALPVATELDLISLNSMTDIEGHL